MEDYPKHLYLILYPNHALVASQLVPEGFARHYQIGSTRYYQGKLIFAEVDIGFRNDFFPIAEMLEKTKTHEDGRPKATKFISTYRVLEHMDFSALKSLYLATQEGYCLELQKAKAMPEDTDDLRIFVEIAPLRMVVLSRMLADKFGTMITNPENPKGCPKIFFGQLDVDIDDALEEFERNPFMAPPVPSFHPSKLRDAVLEMRRKVATTHKGLSLHTSIPQISFNLFRPGFCFASPDETLFYPVPSAHEIETTNYRFYKAM